MPHILLLVIGLILSGATWADTPPRREISVQGQAARSLTPDQARLTISVEGRAKLISEAMNLAGSHAQAVIDTLQDFAEKRQIRALQTQVREVVRGTTRSWRRDSAEPMEVLASRQIEVESLRIDKLPLLMTALSQQPLARVDRVQAYVSNEAEIQDEILLLAIDDAKLRAQRVADRLGVSLGLPISVAVHALAPSHPHQEMRTMAVMADAGGGYDAVGENEVRASVAIRFELEAD